MRTVSVVLCVLCVAARLAAAQAWCDSAGSYKQCALWLDADNLRRGSDGRTVAVAGQYMPIPLRRFVVGDSALKYAARYEHHALRAGTVRYVGAGLLLAGSIMQLSQARGGETRVGRGMMVMGSGIGMYLVSIPLRLQADEEGRLAVWWNNSRLSAAH